MRVLKIIGLFLLDVITDPTPLINPGLEDYYGMRRFLWEGEEKMEFVKKKEIVKKANSLVNGDVVEFRESLYMCVVNDYKYLINLSTGDNLHISNIANETVQLINGDFDFGKVRYETLSSGDTFIYNKDDWDMASPKINFFLKLKSSGKNIPALNLISREVRLFEPNVSVIPITVAFKEK